MSLKMEKKHVYILIGSILGIALIMTGLYFWLLYPLKSNLAAKQNELQNEQKLLTALQSQTTQSKEDTFETTVELQKRLPVKPLVEQLLLDFEKAETISKSFIMEMSFAEEEASDSTTLAEFQESQSSASKDGGAAEDASVEGDAETNADSDSQNKESPEENSSEETLPVGVKKITASLRVKSPSFFELEEFISTLESTRRIIKVDNLSFKGPLELTSILQMREALDYTVSVSAFYSPSLADLQEQLPPLETPNPANKRDPFTNAANLPEQKKPENNTGN
ncbi:pilus assembly protein PilO [Bacillus sp. M6-12]|uniref:pilus assembly protein PilO n=1 Tax=Bacillus sp. M6-12 TaxID=2054166 RepID=UPI000C786872|nr:pilus assembly protein PilO [Bacillus sp. M6-12]PLS16859.1 pilus assembly protein PilO [Bacillus sp. M6-12]